MNNTFESGALGTVPPVPTSPSVGYPTDGNPGTATPPTIPGSHWFYMITAEIMGAITAAGITPSASAVNQLELAIIALAGDAAPVSSVNGRTGAVVGLVNTSDFTGANQSLGSTGYQKLPGGLIVQWGTSPVTAGSNTSSVPLTFPLAFPNAVYVVFGNADKQANGSWDEIAVSMLSRSLTGCAVQAGTSNVSQALQAGINVMWVAFGR